MINKCVYFHRIPNGPVFYVGMGNINRAYNSISRNKKWKETVKTFGFEVIIIAENLSLNQACEIEKFWIQLIGVNNLTNVSIGGQCSAQGIKHTLETRMKISENSATKRPEIRKKLQEIMKGAGNPMYGKNHTLEARAKISNSRIGQIAKQSTKNKMSIARKGEKNNAYDHRIHKFSNIECVEYLTQHNFRNKYSFSQSAISQLVSGKRKTHKGWKYEGTSSIDTCAIGSGTQ